MKNPWIVPVAALVVGAAGGYLSGKGTGEVGKTESSEVAPRSSSSSRSASAATETAKKTKGGSTESIARMPGNSSRIQALLEFYAGLTPEQLAEEATKLDGLPMNERIMASILLFGRWAEVDAQAAMAFSNTMGFTGGFVRPTILQSWSSVDPENAAKYYAENPREFAMMGMMGGGRGGPMGGQGGASIIASEWARQDPAAAMAWASSLTTEKGAAMGSVISEIAKTDPRKAAGMIGQMDEGDQAGAYNSVATQYGALDFTEAQNWVRTLPADQQARALASAIEGLSGKDPVEAARQVDLMPDGEARDNIIDDVVTALARRDTGAAKDFLKKQTSQNAQREALRSLIPTLTNQDPATALVYAKSFPAGPVQDRALETWIWSNNTSKPATLVSEAGNITDEGDRTRAMAGAYVRWMSEDPAGAKSSIQTSSLPDEMKERISEGRGMWGGGGGGGGRGRGRGR